jgi:aryl-alcohol dehydrogenase-like predicted oxidoreductase
MNVSGGWANPFYSRDITGLIFYIVARRNGMTPFSVYQGKWNAAFRDMEAELIPMCEDQRMAIVPWGALGQGKFLSSEQRKQLETNPGARKAQTLSEDDVKVCEVLEQIANNKGTTMQAIVSNIRTLSVLLNNDLSRH